MIRRFGIGSGLLGFVLALVVLGCGGGGGNSDPVSNCNLDTFTPNYAHKLSHLLNWPSFPVTVAFVQDSNFTTARHNLAVAGFNQWVTATGGVISYNEIASTSNADITVSFDPTTQNGLTTLTFSGLTMLHADMHLGVQNQADIDLQAIAAHEMGHALGIDGHSDASSDLMYPVHFAGTQGVITARDLNTMKTGYCSLFSRAACCSGAATRGGPIQTKTIQ